MSYELRSLLDKYNFPKCLYSFAEQLEDYYNKHSGDRIESFTEWLEDSINIDRYSELDIKERLLVSLGMLGGLVSSKIDSRDKCEKCISRL